MARPKPPPVNKTCSCGAVFISNRGGKYCSRKCQYAGQGSKITRHGQYKSRIYHIWANMKYRCFNPRSTSYARYGGRGITVCARWQSFENFLADMGDCPSPKHSVDRIDNSGNYEPSNCRWATSRTTKITVDGRTLPLTEWADVAGLPIATLRGRIAKGMDATNAVTTSKQPNACPNRKLTDDEVKTIKRRLAAGEKTMVIAREYGLHRSHVRLIRRGEVWARVSI